jgi:hypothetical protein
LDYKRQPERSIRKNQFVGLDLIEFLQQDLKPGIADIYGDVDPKDDRKADRQEIKETFPAHPAQKKVGVSAFGVLGLKFVVMCDINGLPINDFAV